MDGGRRAEGGTKVWGWVGAGGGGGIRCWKGGLGLIDGGGHLYSSLVCDRVGKGGGTGEHSTAGMWHGCSNRS